MQKTRLRVTITYEYDSSGESYGTNDPVEMAKIDENSWHEHPELCLSFLEEDVRDSVVPFTVKVEPVE